MTLRSGQFDDVYFSAADGLAETRHVFLEGNNLPAAWQGKDEFVIAETGFGTGLNFLAVWKLFEEAAAPDQKLHFLSVEKYPLPADQARDAISAWDLPEMPAVRYDEVQEITDRISLEVHTGDANDILQRWDRPVDAWFLDGFKPSSNPEMWTEGIFEHVYRLTKPGGRFATFTAAGFVRRGLQSAGFAVEKIPGFGTKREMLRGVKP